MSKGCCELDYDNTIESKAEARIKTGILILLSLIALVYLIWIA
jgi:hypothetical protein